MLSCKDLSQSALIERCDAVRAAADLFLLAPTNHAAEDLELFDTVLSELLAQVNEEVCVYLSERFSDLPAAPRRVVETLASDERIAVARPVLSRSTLLNDTFLLQQARSAREEHLLAISSRETVAAAITDVLIERGHDKVLLAVVRNEGAAFSKVGKSLILSKAKHFPHLAAALWERPDISRHQLAAMFGRASDQVRRALMERGFDAGNIDSSLAVAKAQLHLELSAGSASYQQALSTIAAMQAAGGISESHTLEFARKRQFEEVVASLSELSGLPIIQIEKMLSDNAHEALLTLLKALDFRWTTAQYVLALNPERKGSGPDWEEIRIGYSKIERQAASKALAFHKLREKAKNAAACSELPDC